MNENFKTGFTKSAQEAGYTTEEANELFAQKMADHQGDYFQNVKDIMQGQGLTPQYNVEDTHPSALNYNNALMQTRDAYGTKDPNMEGLKSGIGHGAIGAILGSGGGHLAGQVASKFVNPKYTNVIKHLPRWGKALGIAGGAVAAGLPAFERSQKRVETMHQLNDPRIMQAMLDQLSRERQLTNNQLGTYRPIGIEPQGY